MSLVVYEILGIKRRPLDQQFENGTGWLWFLSLSFISFTTIFLTVHWRKSRSGRSKQHLRVTFMTLKHRKLSKGIPTHILPTDHKRLNLITPLKKRVRTYFIATLRYEVSSLWSTNSTFLQRIKIEIKNTNPVLKRDQSRT